MKHKVEEPYDNIILVGAGGTGGFVVPNLVRMISHLPDISNLPAITVVDADIVESKNCNRQNFIFNDISKNKSEVLATRYSAAFGIPINFLTEKLTFDNFYKIDNGNRILIIDAVDKARARLDIWRYVRSNRRIDWLSLGNTDKYGQAVFYSKHLFGNPARSVVDVFPDNFTEESMLKAEREERARNCADNAVQNPQSIAINLTAANVAINIIYQLLYDKEIEHDVILFDRYNDFRCVKVGSEVFVQTEQMANQFAQLLSNLAA